MFRENTQFEAQACGSLVLDEDDRTVCASDPLQQRHFTVTRHLHAEDEAALKEETTRVTQQLQHKVQQQQK